MKNTIAKCLALGAMLALLPSASPAQEDPLAGIVIEDGWMTGTVTAHFSVGSGNEFVDEIKVDCPEPPEAYPSEILTVADGYVSKKQMQQALKAAGQSTEGKFVNTRGSAGYTGNWNTEAASDISKEDAAEQAIEIGLKYFAALGVEVDPVPTSISRPYDYDAYMERQIRSYEHSFSDTSTFIDHAKAHWKRTSKYHPKQTEYTSVDFTILLDGMRLDQNPSYPAGYADEPDAWEGYSAGAHVIVSDSGVLVEASCTLLEMTSRRPLEDDPVHETFLTQYQSLLQRKLITADSWSTALSAALADSSHAGLLESNQEDAPYQNKDMDEPVIAYGSRTVITEIHPVLHTISRNEWAPFWTIETVREYSDGWRKD